MATPDNNATLRPTAPSTARQVLTLAVVGVILTIALAAIANITRERVERERQAWIQLHLDALVPPDRHDNDLLTDTITVTSPDLLGTNLPVTVYRARRAGQPVAAILRPIAPDGYRGPIELLVAIAPDGTLIGVQVIRHNETPGLGDAFERREPDWLPGFRGLSLSKPPPQRWTVRRDGGDFDAFTGATITPRAIVKAVRRTLEFHQLNAERLYAPNTQQ